MDAKLQAVRNVQPALEAFYTTLSDEQKARLDARGQARPVLALARTLVARPAHALFRSGWSSATFDLRRIGRHSLDTNFGGYQRLEPGFEAGFRPVLACVESLLPLSGGMPRKRAAPAVI